MRKVYYKEIPNFPQESLASMKGHVIFGTIEKTRVVCLVNCDFEGLDVYEAYYLVQVLIGLGIRHLHYVFPVVNYITALHGIDDYLNFKLQGCAEVQSNDACTISSLGNKLVIGLPGPGLPSPSEIVMCASYNLDFITISNFAILNEAGNRGLSHSASCFHSNLIDDSFSIDSLTEYLTSTNYFSKFYVKSSISFPFFHANSDLDQLESPENSQDLEDLAVEIKTIYDPNKAVIVSDSIGDLLLRHFTVIRSFAFGTFFPQTFHFTEDGVMIIKGSPILKHKDNHYRMMFPTFMVNRLGIDNVIIIEEASTCSSLISVGTWAKISDMGGFVSFNPLNGPNQSS